MKVEFDKKYFTIAVYSFSVIAAAIVFYLLVSNLSHVIHYISAIADVLFPFVLAFGLAFVLNCILKFVETKLLFKLQKRKKLRRALGLLITYLFASLLIVVFAYSVLPQIISSVAALVNSIPDFTEQVTQMLEQIKSTSSFISDQTDEIINSITQFFTRSAQLLNSVLPYLLGFTKAITSGLSNGILAIIISIYMLADKERLVARLKKCMFAIMPKRFVERLIVIMKGANETFTGFIVGKLIDSLIIGLLCFGGMKLFQMPYPVLISVVVGVTNVIPYFGPFIGAIPSILLILFIEPIQALWFAIFILVLQQFDGNILGPKILGQSTGLDAILVIFCHFGRWTFFWIYRNVHWCTHVFRIVLLSKRVFRAKAGKESAAGKDRGIYYRAGGGAAASFKRLKGKKKK